MNKSFSEIRLEDLKHDREVYAAQKVIGNVDSGDITSFILIQRACELVKNGTNPTIVANALYQELRVYDWVRDEDEC